MTSFTHRSALLLAVGVLLLAMPAHSQVNWWRFDNNTAITLEVSKVDFKDDLGTALGFFNTVGFVGAQIKTSDNLAVLIEAPWASFDTKDLGFTYFGDQFLIGNPFFGFEYDAPGSPWLARFGLRPPVASDEKLFATAIGMSGAPDRWEAFYPELWTVSFTAGMRTHLQNKLAYQFFFGPTVLKPKDYETELVADYSGLIGYYGPTAKFGVELHGRALITEGDIDFSDRFDHDLGLVAGLRTGQFEPGVHIRYAFDKENRELVDFTWGINVVLNLQPTE